MSSDIKTYFYFINNTGVVAENLKCLVWLIKSNVFKELVATQIRFPLSLIGAELTGEQPYWPATLVALVSQHATSVLVRLVALVTPVN